MNDGSKMLAMIDSEDIKGILDDKTSFIEVFRPDGHKVLIHKGYLAYVFPSDWEELDKEE